MTFAHVGSGIVGEMGFAQSLFQGWQFGLSKALLALQTKITCVLAGTAKLGSQYVVQLLDAARHGTTRLPCLIPRRISVPRRC